MTEQHALSEGELSTLTLIRNRKIFFLVSSYFGIIALLAYAWLRGWLESFQRGEEEVARAEKLAPYLFGFFFIVLTVYFTKYYLKSVHPLVKDISGGYKKVLLYPAQTYKTPMFDAYYLRTEFREIRMIRISKELYTAIQPGSYASIAYTPHAKFVFSIECEKVMMKFNERNTILEK